MLSNKAEIDWSFSEISKRGRVFVPSFFLSTEDSTCFESGRLLVSDVVELMEERIAFDCRRAPLLNDGLLLCKLEDVFSRSFGVPGVSDF